MTVLYTKPLFKEITVLTIMVAGLHLLALKLFLYWTTNWFDIPMHFLGGLLIGLIMVFVCYVSGYFNFPTTHQGSVFAVVLGGVLVVGLAWELWEIFVGLTDVIADQADTILDVIMDMLGGLVALGYAKSLLWNNKTN
jgi:hypothetical protein